MKKNSKTSLISAVAFVILGVIMFIDPSSVVKFISYFLGGILILIGLYKTINYYIQDKRLKVVNNNEMAFGITAIILGIIFIFLASAIELLLRFVIGGWVVIAGLNKISQTFYTTNRDSKFYSLIVVGLILIGIGLYIILVSNLALSIIGLFMIIYGIIDFISYFVYKDMFTEINIDDIASASNVVIDSDVMEAEIVDEDKKDDVDKDSKKNKKEVKTKKKKSNK